MRCFTMPTAHLATTVLHPNLKPQHFHSAPFQKEKHRLPIYPSTKTDTAATAANMLHISNGWQREMKHAIKARRHTAKVTMQKI